MRYISVFHGFDGEEVFVESCVCIVLYCNALGESVSFIFVDGGRSNHTVFDSCY